MISVWIPSAGLQSAGVNEFRGHRRLLMAEQLYGDDGAGRRDFHCSPTRLSCTDCLIPAGLRGEDLQTNVEEYWLQESRTKDVAAFE